MFVDNNDFKPHLLADYIKILKSLVHDLEELQAGRMPTEELLKMHQQSQIGSYMNAGVYVSQVN